MSRAGSPAEIGSISFGLTANPAPAVKALNEVKQEAEKATVAVERTATTVAQSTAAAAQEVRRHGGVIGGSIKDATKGFHEFSQTVGRVTHLVAGGFGIGLVVNQIAGLVRWMDEVNARIKENHKLAGQARQALFDYEHPTSGGTDLVERIRKESEDYQKIVSNLEATPFDTKKEKASALDRAAEEFQRRLRDLNAKAYADAEHRDEEFAKARRERADENATADAEYWRQDAEQRDKATEAEKQRIQEEIDAQQEGFRAKEQAFRDYQSKLERVNSAMVSRFNAARSNLIDNTTVDISRIRALMEVTRRQPLPPDLGSGMQ